MLAIHRRGRKDELGVFILDLHAFALAPHFAFRAPNAVERRMRARIAEWRGLLTRDARAGVRRADCCWRADPIHSGCLAPRPPDKPHR
jgi:hypothetical protein